MRCVCVPQAGARCCSQHASRLPNGQTREWDVALKVYGHWLNPLANNSVDKVSPELLSFGFALRAG